jgi:WD40 repeat protein
VARLGKGELVQVAFNGNLAAVASAYQMEVVDLNAVTDENGHFLPLVPPYTGFIVQIAWSPDGSLVAVQDYFQTHFYEVASGQVLWSTPATENFLLSMAFSPDGTRFAQMESLGIENNLQIWEVASEEKVLEITSPAASANLYWSPDGRLIATAEDGLSTEVWSTEDGQQIARLEDLQTDTLIWTPNNRYLLGAGAKWQISSGEATPITDPPADYGFFSPDGLLYALPEEDTVEIYDVQGGGDPFLILELEAPAVWLTWTSDSYALLINDEEYLTTDLWEIIDPEGNLSGEYVTTLENSEEPLGVVLQTVSAGGEYAATWLNTGDGLEGVLFWATVTGEALGSVNGFTGGIDSIFWSADPGENAVVASGAVFGNCGFRTWDLVTQTVSSVEQACGDGLGKAYHRSAVWEAYSAVIDPESGAVIIRNMLTGELAAQIDPPTEFAYVDILWTMFGERLILAASNGILYLWGMPSA